MPTDHSTITVNRDGRLFTGRRLAACEIEALKAEARRLEGLGLRGRFADEHADIVQTLADQGVTYEV